MPLYDPVPLDDESRARLERVATATLAMQLRKRGITRVFLAGPRPLAPARLVGPAFTLRHIPAREDITREALRHDPAFPQRRAIEETPPGHVLVMDCRGVGGAGMAGDILIARLKARGVAGLVADGPMRDCEAIARLDFPVFCTGAAAPPSMTVHHAIALGEPIACGGVAVLPGDIMVGDADGVVVIPSPLAAEVARDAEEQEAFEAFAAARVAEGRGIDGLYPPSEATLAEYRAWRQGGSE